MAFAIVAFGAIFLLIASGGMLLFYRESVLQRLSSVISPKTQQHGQLKSALQSTGSSLSGMVEQFDRVLPKSQAEISIVQQRLVRAGFREDDAVKIFYGAKVLVPVILCVILFATGLAKASPIFIYIAAAALGFLGPDFWLGRKISQRQAKIRRSLPDVLDLLVICIEAGLSMDQATMRTSQELASAHPAICDELSIVVLEQRAGRPRADCWKNLADRSDVDSLRNLVSVLVQSEQFGTSIAKTLRVHSDNLRTQRMQKVEELAAKTTVKLVFPLVLFIFPSLFLVVLGPALILMSEQFQKFLSPK